ncbi:protein FAM13A-like [Scleropages formosus]|uniref:protein FAM13A-like n=1 Tax=Scleropages formosus TaxID=113540 RepID=UPI0010FAB7ED|nr:protein FAM13A-like [Scleropages formosus]
MWSMLLIGCCSSLQASAMKIQEALSGIDMGRVYRIPRGDGCEGMTSLDGSAPKGDDHCGDPSPVEAQLSPLPGGSLIQQLLEEDNEPLPSPRSHTFRHGQRFEDDTEVPPSPPNTHSFVSRQRSLSLDASVDDRQELTAAQVTKKIHALRRKVRKYEEKFEEQHKYRPSRNDKAADPDVLRWLNELTKLEKELRDCRMRPSEDHRHLGARQRSYTLPRNFGSQMEKAVDPGSTHDALRGRLREEDAKDETHAEVRVEMAELQKTLLYCEKVHSGMVTKSENETLKPLSDRHRLVKQLFGRPSIIPVIEEEDDEELQNEFAVTVKPNIRMLGLLDHLDEEDCFILPFNKMSSKDSSDTQLSNLHLTTMSELLEQLQEARVKKTKIRQKLREFEDAFFRMNGRNVQKEDRSALAKEYSEYKNIKAKLRLIEVLIRKRDSEDF